MLKKLVKIFLIIIFILQTHSLFCDDSTRVVLYDVQIFSAEKSPSPNLTTIPSDEPSVYISQQESRIGREINVLFSSVFELINARIVERRIVVEFNRDDRRYMQPGFFQINMPEPFVIWFFEDTAQQLPARITLSLSVDGGQEEFIPQLKFVMNRNDQISIAKLIIGQSEGGEKLTSLQNFQEEAERSFIMLVVPLVFNIDSYASYQTMIDKYVSLCLDISTSSVTKPLSDDKGYQFLTSKFDQCFTTDQLMYGRNKQIPLSSKETQLPEYDYDTPPRLMRGHEAIEKALMHVFSEDERRVLAHKTIEILIDKKGNVIDLNAEGIHDQNLRRNLYKALTLVRWQPAQKNGFPVSVWTVLTLPELR